MYRRYEEVYMQYHALDDAYIRLPLYTIYFSTPTHTYIHSIYTLYTPHIHMHLYTHACILTALSASTLLSASVTVATFFLNLTSLESM